MRILHHSKRVSFSPPGSKAEVSILVGKNPEHGAFEKHTIATVKIPAGAQLDEHFHKAREESYLITSGSGTIVVNGEETKITVGDLVSVSPGERHRLVADQKQSLEYIVVTAPAWTIEDVNT